MKWSVKMYFLFAIGILVLWLILIPIIDKQIKKRGEKIEEEGREYAIALNDRCDQLDEQADKLAQEILRGMQNVEFLPEEHKQKFMDKYSDLMLSVNRIKDATKLARKQFPLKEELVDV